MAKYDYKNCKWVQRLTGKEFKCAEHMEDDEKCPFIKYGGRCFEDLCDHLFYMIAENLQKTHEGVMSEADND